MDNKILVKRLSQRAKIPVKKMSGDAGFDLIAPTPVYMEPFTFRCIGLEIALQVPNGYCGKIIARSGLALSNQIFVLGGLIDSTYRGEIKVLLMNFGQYPLDLPQYSRIAQLTIERIHEAEEMIEVADLEETERNKDGFGSTGLI